MGNQQGIKIKTNANSLAKSDGIPRKRAGVPLCDPKETPKSQQQTANLKRKPALWMISNPTKEDVLEEERHFIYMDSSLGQEMTFFDCENDSSQMDLKHSTQEYLYADRKCSFSCGEEDIAESTSDSDFSEYDNICSLFDLEPNSEDIQRSILNSKLSSENEAVGKYSQTTTAASVMRKIEEVEGIISRVSRTSSDWLKGNDPRYDVKPEFMDDHFQDKECEYNKRRVIDEFRLLSEELSKSLQRALRMESERKDSLLESLRESMEIPSHNGQISTLGNQSISSCLSRSAGIPNRSLTSPSTSPLLASRCNHLKEDICDQQTWGSSENDSWTEKEILDWTNHRWREDTQMHRCLSEYEDQDNSALQKQEEAWHQEIEESLTFCRWLSHPSRPKLIDFLRITAPEDDFSRTPTPMFPELRSETSSPVEEEWTPGRLQAVWPPPKEEKVGLKYTEAEHQAALLQLKRECKEEVEKLQEDFWQELSKLRVENEATVSQLKLTLAELQSKLSKLGSLKRGELRDAAVSTQDDKFPHKAFRNVCIQTDRETFIKKDDDRDKRDCSPTLQQKVTPKKLDLASISINLAGRREEGPPCQSGGVQAPTNTVNAPPPPLSPMLSHKQQIKAPPPPPPLPCPSQIMPDKQTFKTPPPPPLAPFMSAVSPPPPPPPPFTSHLTSTLLADPRKPVVEPSCPMKPLYWTRIQIEDNKNNTVWNILKEPNIMNTVEFEDLFAKNTTRLKRKPLVENYKKTKTKKIIKLLDSKRSQAVGILMSSLHLEIKDIRQAILSVDNSVVDLETIEALYENRGQPEELEKIKTHHETSKEEELKLLDKPEQFLYELSQISDFAERARCIIFKAAFNDGMASIQHKLHIMSSVCEALLEQNGVKDVLGLILALGNHMNGGNRVRGQADGFNLEILPKLKDVKSRDNRISLVDYMVSYYLHNVDKNAGTDKSTFPLPEPQDVFLAAQLNFEDLNAELKKLGKDLTGCEKNVQKVCLNSPEEHLQPFKDRMEAFLITARKEHIGASSQFITAQKSFQDLCVYFGLKPKAGEKEVTSSHFFMLWFEFCADFNTRWKRENRNFTKERLKEAQQSVKRITAEKKVETRKINSNSLKERLRQKEANKTQI